MHYNLHNKLHNAQESRNDDVNSNLCLHPLKYMHRACRTECRLAPVVGQTPRFSTKVHASPQHHYLITATAHSQYIHLCASRLCESTFTCWTFPQSSCEYAVYMGACRRSATLHYSNLGSYCAFKTPTSPFVLQSCSITILHAPHLNNADAKALCLSTIAQ